MSSRKGSSYSSKRRRIMDAVEANMNILYAHPDPFFDSVTSDDGSLSLSPVHPLSVENESPSVINDDDDHEVQSASHDMYHDFDESFESDSDSDQLLYSTPDIPLSAQLANWALEHNITHGALKGLLSILKPYHDSLPADPRTLLQTPRHLSLGVKSTDGVSGKYYHFGIDKGLHSLSSYLELPSCLKLQINIDGLPLFKSSATEFWPILCLVRDCNVRPFVVGLYCGKKKPSCLSSFLADLVLDLNNLLRDGLFINEIHHTVLLDCFICDAPARAYVKNVKTFSGYSGCDKCCQEGVYIDGRMTYPEVNAKLRDDKDFHMERDIDIDNDEHRRGPTPLSQLDVGLVSQFALDYMHQVCLGVVKKLVKFWLSGPLRCGDAVASRLPAQKVRLLSERLERLSGCVPMEFSRRPRTICEVERWKATEFRTFLLYTGPVVLQDILPEAVYQHFLLLSVAITLLTTPRYYLDHNSYASDLLVTFVKQCTTIYGSTFLVYNVHALIHLAAEAQRFGPLDSFSAFPFENELRCLKALVHSNANPLPQIMCRIWERRRFTSHKVKDNKIFECSMEHCKGPCPEGFELSQEFCKLQHSNVSIRIDSLRNGCISVDGLGFFVVCNILKLNGSIFLVCRKFQHECPLFHYPLDSSGIGCVCVSELSDDTVVLPFSDSICKCVCLPHPSLGQYAVIPMCHFSC